MPAIEIDKKGIVGDLLGGGGDDNTTTAQEKSTQAAKSTAVASSSTGKDDTTTSATSSKAGKSDSASSSASASDKATSSATDQSSATSASSAVSTVANSAAVSTTSSSAAQSTASSTSASLSSETPASSTTSDSGTLASASSTQSASDSVSTTASATALGDNASASLSSTSASSTASLAAVAANASASTSSTIFSPDNKLFPLAMVVVSLGGLFVIITTVVLLIRAFGWNRRRRTERSAIPSTYMGSDPSFEPIEPKRFETITNNIASTNPGEHDNYNHVAYSANASAVNEPLARPIRAQYVAAGGPTPNPYDGVYYDEKSQQHMGSPVPSFNTQRGFDQPLSAGVYDYGAQYQQQPPVPQRSDTRSSAYLGSSGGSMGSQMMGQNPSQAGYAKRYSGSGQSFKSVASSKSERSNGKLGKGRY
ncbi:hypothetical protein IAR50_002890 [Cryptococcus sp. DSM 104548]